MELKWLEDFCALAELSSFSRAAVSRHVTQSAFSRRIKQLEGWLGVPLINRATLPAELTPAGQRFLPVAQDTIRQLYAGREMLQPSVAAGMIRIAALHTLTITFFPDWLERLATRLEGLRSVIIPDRGGIEANLAALIDAEADFFLTYNHPDVPLHLDHHRFESRHIGHDRLLPVAAPVLQTASGQLAGHGSLDHALATQRPLPYLGYGASSFFGVALQRLFARRPAFNRQIRHENTISAGLKRLALIGAGVCWLPASLVQQELADGRLVMASNQDGWTLTLDILLYRAGEQTGPAGKRFWRAVQQLDAPPAN